MSRRRAAWGAWCTVIGAIATTLVTADVAGQTPIDAALSGLADGAVAFSYEGRPGVCGDGAGLVGLRRAEPANEVAPEPRLLLIEQRDGHVSTFTGRSSRDDDCVPGVVRVEIGAEGGQIVRIRTRVGGASAGARVRDLGAVSPADAAAYLYRVGAVTERERLGRAALVAAFLAAGVDPVPPLEAIARSVDRPIERRRHAAFWLAMEPGTRSLAALERLLEAVSEPALREHVVFAIAQHDDERKGPVLRGIALTEQSAKVRRAAFFWLGQSGNADDGRWLRDSYDRLSDRELKRHLIFVLSQRRETEAADKLMTIARSDTDARLRQQALFWLAQVDGERAERLIRELLRR
ncbi:MAG: HEAT repeat domain-containing protein [Longimicrobiales bacterium]